MPNGGTSRLRKAVHHQPWKAADASIYLLPSEDEKLGGVPSGLLRLLVPRSDVIAPIIWARWGNIFLEVLRQEAAATSDGLAFEAMNSEAGVRTILVICTTRRAQIQVAEEILSLQTIARPVDWASYSAAELIFRTDKRGGLSHQELRDGSGRIALILCATCPAAVETLEKLFDLPE